MKQNNKTHTLQEQIFRCQGNYCFCQCVPGVKCQQFKAAIVIIDHNRLSETTTCSRNFAFSALFFSPLLPFSHHNFCVKNLILLSTIFFSILHMNNIHIDSSLYLAPYLSVFHNIAMPYIFLDELKKSLL